MELTGFEWIPGTKLKHIVQGIFVFLISFFEGNMDKLKSEWLDKPPYIKINFEEVFEIGEKIFYSFCGYIEAVYKAVVENLPKVFKELGVLVGKLD